MSADVTRLDDHRPRILGAVQLVRRYSRARGSARAVLTVLASYADADGTGAFPGTATIARDAGVSPETVKRARRKLIALGEVEVVEQGFGSRSTRYRITLSPPVGEPVDKERTRSSRGVNLTPGRGQPDTPRGVQTDPLPYIDRPDTGGETPPRCSRHAGVEDPPPCRGCATARERREALDRDEARTRADQERTRREETARLEREERLAAAAPPEVRANAVRTARAGISRNRTRSGTVIPSPRKARP